mgnify:CR=1 FL=1
MNAYDIIIQPWLTEKSMEARTTEQRLEFIVRRSATKAQIARAVETIFDVEVAKVNVRNSKHGKHASVKLAEGYDAEDAAMRLGAFGGELTWVREYVHNAKGLRRATEWQAIVSPARTACLVRKTWSAR